MPVGRIAVVAILGNTISWAATHQVFKQDKPYKSTIRTLIPLIITGVTLFVKVTGTLGRVRQNLIVLGPCVTRTEGSASNLRIFPVGDTDCHVMQLSKGAMFRLE